MNELKEENDRLIKMVENLKLEIDELRHNNQIQQREIGLRDDKIRELENQIRLLATENQSLTQKLENLEITMNEQIDRLRGKSMILKV